MFPLCHEIRREMLPAAGMPDTERKHGEREQDEQEWDERKQDERERDEREQDERERDEKRETKTGRGVTGMFYRFYLTDCGFYA